MNWGDGYLCQGVLKQQWMCDPRGQGEVIHLKEVFCRCTVSVVRKILVRDTQIPFFPEETR